MGGEEEMEREGSEGRGGREKRRKRTIHAIENENNAVHLWALG